jgi:hypothetical protein
VTTSTEKQHTETHSNEGETSVGQSALILCQEPRKILEVLSFSGKAEDRSKSQAASLGKYPKHNWPNSKAASLKRNH